MPKTNAASFPDGVSMVIQALARITDELNRAADIDKIDVLADAYRRWGLDLRYMPTQGRRDSPLEQLAKRVHPAINAAQVVDTALYLSNSEATVPVVAIPLGLFDHSLQALEEQWNTPDFPARPILQPVPSPPKGMGR